MDDCVKLQRHKTIGTHFDKNAVIFLLRWVREDITFDFQINLSDFSMLKITG